MFSSNNINSVVKWMFFGMSVGVGTWTGWALGCWLCGEVGGAWGWGGGRGGGGGPVREIIELNTLKTPFTEIPIIIREIIKRVLQR